MFIWLASYPKSGNTLVRSLLSSYFFSKDGIFDFELIKNIKQFPNINLFEKMGIDIKDDDEVIKNYIKVQNSFCKKNSVQFLKTHSYLFNFYNKYSFTDLMNSLGVIYIVRDPRSVVISLANFQNISLELSTKTITSDIFWGGNLNAKDGSRTKVWTGIWSQNFNSWKSFNYQDKYLLIKYEDLVNNTEVTFLKILKFVYKLNDSNFKLNTSKFENALKTTSFENMKNLEKKEGFEESKIDQNTNKIIPFFNLGPKNDWKKILGPKLKKKVEKCFEKEMVELNYL